MIINFNSIKKNKIQIKNVKTWIKNNRLIIQRKKTQLNI